MVKSTETKKEIRKNFLSMRSGMPEEEMERAGEAVTDRILSSRSYEDVRFLYCYVSYGSEVDTRRLIEESLKRGKRVAVPRAADTGWISAL